MYIITLRGSLGVEQAEHAIGGALAKATQGDALHLNMLALRSFAPGAAARLGNSLRRLSENTRLTVTLPSDDAGLRALTESGIGPQIASYARTIKTLAGPDTREQRRALQAPPLLPATSMLLQRLTDEPRIVSRSRAQIRSLLDHWLSAFPPQRGRLPSTEERDSIVQLISEATINILDHSTRRPWDGGDVHSHLELRWRPRFAVSLNPEGFAGEDESTRYMAALLEDGDTFGGVSGILEVTISDDGVGMAARQALTTNVLSTSDVAAERGSFVEALSAGGTVKLRAKDCPIELLPGYGCTRVVEAIDAMHGFASIRTGRLVAVLNSLAGVGDEPAFQIDEKLRCLVNGTIISVLLPVFRKMRPSYVPPTSEQPSAQIGDSDSGRLF